MFTYATPEQVGISSDAVLDFITSLEEYNLSTHSIIMARGDKIFTELYYAPFNADFKHRMYSVSKSFVSVAVGLLEEEGKLSLDDKMLKYFPEYSPEEPDEYLSSLTIRDMLKMQTAAIDHVGWFSSGTADRTEVYFRKPGVRDPGTIFRYDSPGSYMLGVIVENITGKPFLKYLQERVLDKTGFSKDAYCLTCPGGHSFGDSAVMCTSKDLLTFARFVMNYGTWDGERLMNEEYLRTATSRLVQNDEDGTIGYDSYGYGYQIWQAPDNSFAFVGMGDQFAICNPEKDFIFIITSDNQGNRFSRPIFYHELFKTIVRKLSDTPLPENPDALAALCEHIAKAKLATVLGATESPLIDKINGVTYKLSPNPMKMEYVRFDISGKNGTLSYKNAQGEKVMPFGLGFNVFEKFPEEGYSDMVAGVPERGHKYDCAFSAAFTDNNTLQIKAQIIDKYFGNLFMTFGFKDNKVGIQMVKHAEAFLNEYNGFANGIAE